MKRIVLQLLIAILCFSMAGCGGEATTGQSTIPMAPSSESAVSKLSTARLEERVLYTYLPENKLFGIWNDTPCFVAPERIWFVEIDPDSSFASEFTITPNGNPSPLIPSDSVFSPNYQSFARLSGEKAVLQNYLVTVIDKETSLRIYDANSQLYLEIDLSSLASHGADSGVIKPMGVELWQPSGPEHTGQPFISRIKWLSETELVLSGSSIWKVNLLTQEITPLTDFFENPGNTVILNWCGETEIGLVYSLVKTSEVASVYSLMQEYFYYQADLNETQSLGISFEAYSDQAILWKDKLYFEYEKNEAGWWAYDLTTQAWIYTGFENLIFYNHCPYGFIEEGVQTPKEIANQMEVVTLPNDFADAFELFMLSDHQVVNGYDLYDWKEKKLLPLKSESVFMRSSSVKIEMPNGMVVKDNLLCDPKELEEDEPFINYSHSQEMLRDDGGLIIIPIFRSDELLEPGIGFAVVEQRLSFQP